MVQANTGLPRMPCVGNDPVLDSNTSRIAKREVDNKIPGS